MSPVAALTVAVLTLQPSQPDACRVIEPTSAQRALSFPNAVALGPFAMRTSAGVSACDFRAPREGRCRLRAPGTVHVTLDGRHVWYQVDDGRDALVDVSGGMLTCRVIRGAQLN